MSRVKWDLRFNRYLILDADGGIAWMSRRAIDAIFPLYNWDIVREKSGQWFYI